MTNSNGPRQLKVKEHIILIDEEDWSVVSNYKWHVVPDKNTFYARTNMKVGKHNHSIPMHRLLTGMRDVEIDHINRNGLDNRRCNLRYASAKQNQCNRVRKNSFGYRGVYKPKNSSNYAVQIQFDGKKRHERGFKTPEAAAKRYDVLSKEWHGEFGIRNFKD